MSGTPITCAIATFAVLCLATPAKGVAQDSARLEPGLGLTWQGQSGSQPRAGPALSATAWLRTQRAVGWRGEIGLGGYGLVGGGRLCAGTCRSGPPGFPVLLTAHAGMVVPGRADARGMFVSAGLTAAHGFGSASREHRSAILPDLGVGHALDRHWFIESRFRWSPAWEGAGFQQWSIGFGWRRS